MKARPLVISLVILALAAVAPRAGAQQPKPGGQIVHAYPTLTEEAVRGALEELAHSKELAAS